MDAEALAPDGVVPRRRRLMAAWVLLPTFFDAGARLPRGVTSYKFF